MPDGAGPRIHGRKFLVVDDEPDLLEVLALELGRFGVSLLRADGPEMALKVLAETQVDLVLSDVRMHGGGGMELARRIRARDARRPPLLLMSGFERPDLRLAYGVGVEALLEKPFRMERVVAAAELALTPLAERWARLDGTAMPSRELRVRVKDDGKQFAWGRGGFAMRVRGEVPGAGSDVRFAVEGVGERELRGVGTVIWAERARLLGAGKAGILISRLEDAAAWSERFGRVDALAFVPSAL